MWVARNKQDQYESDSIVLWLDDEKPSRIDNGEGKSQYWFGICGIELKPHTKWYDKYAYLTWEHEPIEVGLIELNLINEESINDTIVLTRYYEDYEKKHEWFVNMLKHQEQYKDCTDEEVEEIWKDHIKEKYTFDEIWSTIQCDGYTKIVLRMGRHDIQPEYDYVIETKEYIDEKLKKYL